MRGIWIFFSALVIAVVIALTNHFTIIVGPYPKADGSGMGVAQGVWILDRWTGSVRDCQVGGDLCR